MLSMCTMLALIVTGQDPRLKAAIEACVTEDADGNCECPGTSCSTDPRFSGPIGVWDVSEVRDLRSAFFARPEADESADCANYCRFNGNISAWDTSSVTRMDHMSVRPG